MKEKLNKIAKDTNIFLKKYLKSQKRTDLIIPMTYGLLPGGKKIRSKILIDVGKIFKVKYKNLIQIGAAVEQVPLATLVCSALGLLQVIAALELTSGRSSGRYK